MGFFIDIHCHILPNLDDGPGTMADAVSMVALAEADGVVTMVATPHVYPGLYENTRQSIELARDQLQAELQKAGLQLEVLVGAEYFLEPGLLGRLVEDKILFINRESRTLLVEFPSLQVPAYAESLFHELFLAGIRPVIAHPERNPELVNADLLERLVRRGALLQLTAASLTGRMGRSVQRAAEDLLARGIVHMVASDAHSCRGRTPQLRAAAQKVATMWGESVARRLFYENPLRLLKGEDVVAVKLPGAGRAPGSWWRKVFGIIK